MDRQSSKCSNREYIELLESVQGLHQRLRSEHQNQLDEMYCNVEKLFKKQEDAFTVLFNRCGPTALVRRSTAGADPTSTEQSGRGADLRVGNTELRLSRPKRESCVSTLQPSASAVSCLSAAPKQSDGDTGYWSLRTSEATTSNSFASAGWLDHMEPFNIMESVGSYQSDNRNSRASRVSKRQFGSRVSSILPDTFGQVDKSETMDSYACNQMMRNEWLQRMTRKVEEDMSSPRQTRRSVVQRGGTMWYGSTSMNMSRLFTFIDSRTFATLCAGVIVMNVIFVGYETDASMQDVLGDKADRMDSELYKNVHKVFDIIFGLELCLRIYAWRWYFVLGPEKRYNLLDTFLVSMTIIEQVTSAAGVKSARVVRGLRMMKVLRLARLLRFFSDLRLMVASVVQSCSSLTWALLLLGAIMYLFAIIFMHGFMIKLKVDRDQGEVESVVKPMVEKWYYNLWRTMLTLLQCITSGVDWDEVSRPLAHTTWFYMVIFAFYITFVVIGVLNVLTGIFVERAQELSGLDRDLLVQSEMKRDKAFLDQMKNIFEEADEDNSGSITWDEFKKYLENDEIRAYLSAQQLDACDARQLFDLLDVHGKLQVSMPDFIIGLLRLRGMAKSVDLVALLKETRDMNLKLRSFMVQTDEKLRELSGSPSQAGRLSAPVQPNRAHFGRNSTASGAILSASSSLAPLVDHVKSGGSGRSPPMGDLIEQELT